MKFDGDNGVTRSIPHQDARWLHHIRNRLEQLHPSYNPELRLLRCPFTSPGYHTTIKEADTVHPTKQSLDYALALLDAGGPEYRQRAFDIISTLVSLQDGEPSSSTYGIWSWFWEEPLARMAPPDWNWADFMGKRLMFIWIRHGKLLPDNLRADIRQAVSNCCEAIMRRNVGPEYTNIAIMGAFVTLLAGEELEEARYYEYGLRRLERLYEYSMATGAFLEYNSPPYSALAIVELSALAYYTRTGQARRMAEELLDMTWQMTAEHFHPLLKEWSGPHARSYSTLLDSARLSFLYVACEGEVPFIPEEELQYDPEWYGQGVLCPKRWRGYLERIDEVRELQQQLPPTSECQNRSAFTYVTPAFSLGSFNHNVMWNQCRNLVGYADTGDGEHSYVHLRVLHDGYDFCSAVFQGSQQQASVLYGLQFALDGGDTHVNLDPIYGKTTVSDLRIRLEAGGTGRVPEWKLQDDGKYEMALGDTVLTVCGLYAAMTGFGPFRWEASTESGVSCLDLVVYQGAARGMDFHAMEEAIFLFALTMGDGSSIPPGVSLAVGEEMIQAFWPSCSNRPELRMQWSRKPACRSELFQQNPGGIRP